MGRSFRFARLIGLAVVWEGQTRADIALKQVDHINRKRDDNSPRNLNFLEAMDDAGRSAQSQNTRSALLQLRTCRFARIQRRRKKKSTTSG
ncbi:unnamed protein product [Pelagomonas calceolata]|uniref:HNH nuclease domain-containing protein n=2 Tax=Pelagomonas calceolata TaxID=35677 RepID=A0A8J2SKS4_9STRA|nr:unnamed protein product [Pelagomonas calceolata]